jgi:putative PIN family toxin of toxin-antitoxin system
LESGKVELVFCDELLSELNEVASRPKLRQFFTVDDWTLIFEIIDRYAIHIQVVSTVTLCRDEKDNYLLSLAKDAKANYLLTGDKDLLVLKTFGITQIVTITEFLTIIKKND